MRQAFSPQHFVACSTNMGEGLVMLVTCGDSRETKASPSETMVRSGTFLCTAMAGFLNKRNITTTAQCGQAASYQQ